MGQQTDLFDCRYRSVYEVYTYLAANTAVRPTVPELVERGWIPLIQAGLVGLSTSGYLVWTGNSSGKRQTASELFSGSETEMLYWRFYLTSPAQYIGAPPSYAHAQVGYHCLAVLAVTLDAGAKADQTVLALDSSRKGRVLLRSIMSDTNIAAGFTAHFEDTTPTDCSGLPGGTIVFGAMTAYVPIQLNPPVLVYNLTANKAMRVDYTNGAGVENIVLQYETWYEA